MTTKVLLFDLDGTITDPFPGITGSIRFALREMGVRVPEAEELRWCIGPPLQESLGLLLDTKDPDRIGKAVGLYRERYSASGVFEATLVAGMAALLGDLQAVGFRMFVCTSKPHVFADQIIAHFGLSAVFEKVYGAEIDGRRSNKADLIAHILETEGVQPAEVMMIGDRKHDLIGAKSNNVSAIGVLWGYGDRLELEAESPFRIVDKPDEISAILKN
ncbi:HAD hydrolase-like protein [Roseibium sp. RKSG952]|uniref:HAD hydrolase-like protein n=1 Tax=Roseibium sp. RKSG952 TaxID=2529384 RepID=UPI0012BB50F9|nr:HAD hydrolase-like protein [Roseibium sp. RKSG952]MTH95620.1 HAD family hydrolase [Roseibium sp. RKSG952]